MEYMKTPLNRYTFKNNRIREWVENNSSGLILNLFAGKTKLTIKEVRNDIRKNMPADYHKDARNFVKEWSGDRFDTIILDPPYSFRKSMEMYDGKKASGFNQLKNLLPAILKDSGIVITFGYHSVSMGKARGFNIIKILLISHGGAIHDTIATIEQKFHTLFGDTND